MMHARIRVWALCTVCLVAPAALGDADFLNAEALNEAGLVKFWQLRLPLEPGQTLRNAYLLDDALYVATNDGYVYALDAITGVVRWMQPVTRSGYRLRLPAHIGKYVFFITPTDIQVYDRIRGDGVARDHLRFPPGTGLVTDGERLFVGGIDRRLYALNAETRFISWRAITDGAITANPATYGDFVFAANDAGVVYACTRDKKEFHWSANTYGPVEADLIANENGVFVASRDLSLYLFDLGFGNVRWRVRFSGPLREAPVVTKDLAFQYCDDDGLVAVETSQVGIEDRRRWVLPSGRMALTTHEDNVYVLARTGQLFSVNAKDGEIGAMVPASGFSLGIPSPDNATVYVASEDGRVFCARPIGAPTLTRADVLAAARGEAPDEAKDDTEDAAPLKRIVEIDPLISGHTGRPIGGKSDVTREFTDTESGN